MLKDTGNSEKYYFEDKLSKIVSYTIIEEINILWLTYCQVATMVPTSNYSHPLIVDGACDLLLFFIMSFLFLRALKSSQKNLTEK